MSTVKHVNILFNLHMCWGGVDVNLVGALPSWRRRRMGLFFWKEKRVPSAPGILHAV